MTNAASAAPAPGVRAVDLVVEAGWVIPVEPAGVVLEGHALVVDGGRIVALLPSAKARAAYAPRQRVERPGCVLLPGLVNAHTHNPMTLLRGVADDLPLQQWLTGHIWPAEAAVMGPEYVRDGCELAVAEMLRGGTTCCNENYFFPDVIGATYRRLGFRAVVGLPVIDFPTAWASSQDAYFARASEVHDLFRGDALIGTAFAPHAPYTVDDRGFERIRMLADQLDIPVHCHLHETALEVEEAVAKTGQRPIARLQRLGLFNDRLIAVHMTAITPGEIALCAEHGVSVVHCPESNLKLASGFCPVEALRRAGANVALGTDGCASNNDLDMFGELRTAALLGKGVAGDAAAVDAAYALRMATLNGARALGLEAQIGSLEVGKRADLVTVSVESLEMQPLLHALSQIVYAGGRQHVRDVWIDGNARLRDRTLVDTDVDALLAKSARWGARVRALPGATGA